MIQRIRDEKITKSQLAPGAQADIMLNVRLSAYPGSQLWFDRTPDQEDSN